jgi:hypothetical protein
MSEIRYAIYAYLRNLGYSLIGKVQPVLDRLLDELDEREQSIIALQDRIDELEKKAPAKKAAAKKAPAKKASKKTAKVPAGFTGRVD